MKYAYYALFSKDDGVWSYAFKEVGGFGVGDDLDDAREMAKEAIRLNVQWLIEDGEPIPEPSSREDVEAMAKGDPDYTEWFVELVEVDTTYYAVFFQDCSLFYEVSVYSQEKDEDALIETTTEGLRDALKENVVPPLSRAEVEERARQDEKDGLLPKGWRVVPIQI